MTEVQYSRPGPRTASRVRQRDRQAGPAVVERPSAPWYRRNALALIGLVSVPLTVVGLSGVGDAPAPREPAAAIAAHFVEVRTDVFAGASFGYVAAALMAAFFVGFAQQIHRGGERAAAAVVAVAGSLVPLYFVGMHMVYATLSYHVAEASPDTAKALFVGTIVAVPFLGLVTALALAAAAYGAYRTRLLPRWWAVLSGFGAVLTVLALPAYDDSEFFFPDVAQQTVGTALFLWILVTAVTMVLRNRSARA